MNEKNQYSGFTLIELLLVIGIIAILSSIVIIAVNPTEQLSDARQAERRSEVNAIEKAVTQYIVDGNSISGVPTGKANALDICNGSNTGSSCTGGGTGVDLSVLKTTYLVDIPVDPQEGGSLITAYGLYKDGVWYKVCSPKIDTTCGATLPSGGGGGSGGSGGDSGGSGGDSGGDSGGGGGGGETCPSCSWQGEGSYIADLKDDDTYAIPNAIDINDAGQMVTGYWDYTDNEGNDEYRYHTRIYTGGSWGTQNEVRDENGTDTISYTTADINENGAGVYVWFSYTNSSTYAIKAAVYSSGTWGATTTVSSSHRVLYPMKVIMDDSGDAMLAFIAGSSASNGKLYTIPYDSSSGWGSATAQDESGYKAARVAMDYDSSGDILLTWISFTNISNQSTYRLDFKRYDGSSWGSLETPISGSRIAHETEGSLNIAGDSDGDVYIAYTKLNGSTVARIAYTSSSWGSAEEADFSGLTDFGTEFIQGCRIDVNAGGTAVAACEYTTDSGTGYEGDMYGVVYSSSWGSPASIETGTSQNINELKLNDAGLAVVAFTDYNSDPADFATISWTSAGGWGSKTALESQSGYAGADYTSTELYPLTMAMSDDGLVASNYTMLDTNYYTYVNSFSE